MLFDLHSHTNASDGRLSPKELVERAVYKGVNVLAITDHDTVAGLLPAHQTIEQQSLELILVDGIEISSRWENKDIHIIGLNINLDCLALNLLIQEQHIKRTQRAKQIAERLAKQRIKGAWEGVNILAGDSTITRAHFARWMVEQGITKDQQSAFRQYLIRGKLGYVPPNWSLMCDVIETIHQAGGQAILAHPSHYKLTIKWLKRLLQAFADAGGDAMEVAHPQQSMQERKLLADLATKYQLFSSQGSDFHYPSPWTELGRNLYLPKGCVEIWSTWQLQTGEK